MKAKKWLALLLSLVLLLGLLPAAALAADDEAAETETTTEITAETASEEASTEESSDPTVQEILDAAAAKFDPDTIVATACGQNVTWRMYFYQIYNALYQYLYYYGMPDFTTDTGDGTSLGEALRENMGSRFIYYCAPQTKAAEAGLTDAVSAELDEQWATVLETYETEEAVEELLGQEYLDKDTFLFLLGSNAAFTVLMDSTYGEDGSKMTEDEVLAWADEQGYMRCKHILYSFTDSDGNTLDDDAKAELLTTAEATVAELRTLESDREAMLARFDEIMTEVDDDPGMTTFPDGYTFTDGAMVTEFEDGTKALAEYEISDVVETSYGYHIILRLPLDPETATLSQNSSTGAYMTLREDAANELFNTMLTGWIEEGTVEWQNGFENLNYTALFTIDDTDLLTGVEKAAETEATEETTTAEATEETTTAEATGTGKKTNIWLYVAIAAIVVLIAVIAVLIGQIKQGKAAKATETAEEPKPEAPAEITASEAEKTGSPESESTDPDQTEAAPTAAPTEETPAGTEETKAE